MINLNFLLLGALMFFAPQCAAPFELSAPVSPQRGHGLRQGDKVPMEENLSNDTIKEPGTRDSDYINPIAAH